MQVSITQFGRSSSEVQKLRNTRGNQLITFRKTSIAYSNEGSVSKEGNSLHILNMLFVLPLYLCFHFGKTLTIHHFLCYSSYSCKQFICTDLSNSFFKLAIESASLLFQATRYRSRLGAEVPRVPLVLLTTTLNM